MGSWQALYYDLGSGTAGGASSFHIMDYNVSTANYMIPVTYVLLAVVNGDSGYCKFTTGVQLSSNQSYTVGTSSSANAPLANTAKYADLAEMYEADDHYMPGTVMIFGGDHDVTISKNSHDTAIAGVVSTNPAYLMNDNFEQDNWVPVALTGRVPCMVRGPVAKGTLLVSSEIKGVACALDKSQYEPGCIIGKSMDIISDSSIKKIEIAVGRF